MTDSAPAWETPQEQPALDLKPGLKTFRGVTASLAVFHLLVCAYFILDDLSSSSDFLNGVIAVFFGLWALLPLTVLLLLWLSVAKLHRKGKTVIVYTTGAAEILGGPVVMVIMGLLTAS